MGLCLDLFSQGFDAVDDGGADAAHHLEVRMVVGREARRCQDECRHRLAPGFELTERDLKVGPVRMLVF